MKSSPEHVFLENNRILRPLRFGQKIAHTAVSPLSLPSKTERKVTALLASEATKFTRR
jgi:hypothetical protein